MLQFTRKKVLRISALVIVLVALYALAGFLLAPRILRSTLLEEIPKSLGVAPTIGDIRFNPFLLQLEIKDFSLAAPNGEKLLGVRRLFVGLRLSSIWHRAYTFANIEIDAPFVNAKVGRDGNLNLLQMRPKPSPPIARGQKQSLPAIRIGSFKVTNGLVAYEDRSRPSPFAARLEPINFELVSFTTGVKGGRFTFTGSSKLGERVEWHGHLSVQPLESDGEFQIDGLRAHTIWEYLEDRLNFVVNSGTIDLHSMYRFSLQDGADFTATVSKLAVNDLAVRPKESQLDWITVPSLQLTGTTVDLLKRQAHADSLTLTGLKLTAWLERDGSLNLLQLAQPRAQGSAPIMPTAASGTPTPAGVAVPAADARPWKFDLRELALREAEISAEDRGTSPAARIVLAPFSLKVGGAGLDLAKAVSVSLDTRINGAGSLSASGEITPQPLAANLALKFDGIELKPAQSYIVQKTSMTLLGGRLSGEAKVRYGSSKPALQISSKLSIAGVRTVDNALHEDFINWERLDLTGVNFQRNPDRLDIEEVAARKLYARVIIEPDTSLNVTRVLAGPGATAVARQPAPNRPVPQAMPVSVKKIVLHASQANFADLSVQPNFATGIQSIEGTVVGLSSKENSRAKVDIHGAVDAFSPVAITGSVSVLSANLYTDLAMSFRNMELSTFNPYSGKFAGYNITKGKLSTELHYKVAGRKLDAQHHLTIEQLEFGEKTESKDAVSLPIKLAVALLKDRNGVIDLDVPVSGTLDDPAFRLGPIIWKVLVQTLEKAVTAPFALLGSLFGGGPELQFIDFRPGSAELDAPAEEKVQSVVRALNQRPQLKIDVPIAWVGELDRPALAEAQLTTQIRAAQPGKAQKLEILAQLYAKSLGHQPKYPESFASLKKAELEAAEADFLEQALRQHLVISDADLAALGKQRAAAVQQALLRDTQVNPERVFLALNDKAKSQDGMVRLELTLK
ncbi:MAG: DUF748 domain-containing protein [Steroidobacteraceae bacterium]